MFFLLLLNTYIHQLKIRVLFRLYQQKIDINQQFIIMIKYLLLRQLIFNRYQPEIRF